MQITLDIPEQLAAGIISAGKDPARAALELMAVEGYRTRNLSEHQVRLMLGFETRMEVHAILAEHDVCLHYSLEDLEVDRETTSFLRSQCAQETLPKAG